MYETNAQCQQCCYGAVWCPPPEGACVCPPNQFAMPFKVNYFSTKYGEQVDYPRYTLNMIACYDKTTCPHTKFQRVTISLPQPPRLPQPLSLPLSLPPRFN